MDVYSSGDLIEVIPLAFESLGVRSMATFIETDVRILIDPGTSLAPRRFGLPPSKLEFKALEDTRFRIQKYARWADVVVISHYHHDHFTPFRREDLLNSSIDSAEKIYENKNLFIKHPTLNINKSQKSRATQFLRNLKKVENCKINYADGKSFKIKNTQIKFSDPLSHGSKGTRLGHVVTTTILWQGEILMHASDVQGPIYDRTKQYILDEKPEILILSGPPIYLQGFVIGKTDIDKAKKNLIEIAKMIPTVVVDHHLLRDLRCFDFIKSIEDAAGKKIMVASEILNKEPNLLEARRKKLFKS